MSTYRVYLTPIPKTDGVFFQTRTHEIVWKWEVRKSEGDFAYGKVEATGIENLREVAKDTAEKWADALADAVSYDYEAGLGVSHK